MLNNVLDEIHNHHDELKDFFETYYQKILMNLKKKEQIRILREAHSLKGLLKYDRS